MMLVALIPNFLCIYYGNMGYCFTFGDITLIGLYVSTLIMFSSTSRFMSLVGIMLWSFQSGLYMELWNSWRCKVEWHLNDVLSNIQ